MQQAKGIGNMYVHSYSMQKRIITLKYGRSKKSHLVMKPGSNFPPAIGVAGNAFVAFVSDPLQSALEELN